MDWYLKLKSNFLDLAFSPETTVWHWAFYLSIVAAVAFTLLAVTFGIGFVGGLFTGWAVGSVYAAFRILWEYR